MRVSYTQEQRDTSVRTYHQLKSCEKTIRVLGYPSRHMLIDWVRNPGPKPKPHAHRGGARRYAWTLKRRAVERLMSDERSDDVARDMGVANGATIYAWARKWRAEATRDSEQTRE